MSLTYTTQHYEWQQRVNKELFLAMRFDQFYNTSSRFAKSMRSLPSVRRVKTPSTYSARENKKETIAKLNEERPLTRSSAISKKSLATTERSYKDQDSVSIKTYIKELEDQLREEKIKRIKSEAMLKQIKINRK